MTMPPESWMLAVLTMCFVCLLILILTDDDYYA